MKQTKPNLLIVLMALAVFAAALHVPAHSAWAQEAALKVGVLDFEYIFRKSKAGSGLLATVKANQKKLDDEAAATGKKFREEQKKIEAACQDQSADECKTKRDKFLGEMKAAEDGLNDKRKSLEKRLVDGKNQITKALEPIVQKIIDDNKLTLVLDRAAVMFRDPSYDITQEALKGLDAKLAKL
jgi:outer membrane protein